MRKLIRMAEKLLSERELSSSELEEILMDDEEMDCDIRVFADSKDAFEWLFSGENVFDFIDNLNLDVSKIETLDKNSLIELVTEQNDNMFTLSNGFLIYDYNLEEDDSNLHEAFSQAIINEITNLQNQIKEWDENNNPEFVIEQLAERITWLANLDFSIELLNSDILPKSIKDNVKNIIGGLL